MSTMQRRAALGLAALLLAAVAPPASFGQQPSFAHQPSPRVAVAGVDHALPPRWAAPVREGAAAALAAGTRRYARTFFVRYRNLFGGTLWRYNCRWEWHVRRGRIVRATHWEWPSALAPGWSYRGTRYLQRYGRLGTRMVGRRVLGHFVWTVPGLGALRHKYPWIDVKVYASGNHWVMWDDG
jgi:hypothetical protein